MKAVAHQYQIHVLHEVPAQATMKSSVKKEN